jgi:hypothetical protein
LVDLTDQEALDDHVYDRDPLLLLTDPAPERERRKGKQLKKRRVTSFVPNGTELEAVGPSVPIVEEPESSDEKEGSESERRRITNYSEDDSHANLAATCFMAAATSVDNVPVTYSQAMKRPDKDSWKEAFDAEWNAINGNDTFEYVALPEGKKPINCRWVLTIKDGGQFKARLVAKGFSQVEGIDYNETFAPVIRYESVRLLLATAAEKSLEIHQMDVKTAFLNGALEEEIYMKQPDGYDQVPGKVLKLKKSIYGLKQAPLVWNQNINGTLEKIGFIRNSAELGLYHKNDGDKTIILGLYVDDILLASNDEKLLKQTKDL